MSESLQSANQQVAVPSRLRVVKSRVPKPVKAALRHTARGIGLATANFRTDPDFLIIGTKRGGTTSLWNAMLNHPDMIGMFPQSQEIKSPHYFDINYGKGQRWYRSHFPTNGQRRRHEHKTGHIGFSGEASPYYMFHPLAAQRIHQDLPAVKLIVSLRDPVERIWSHYAERFGSGTEVLPFAEALSAEPGRTAGEVERIIAGAPGYYSFHHDLSTYLARGRYVEHLAPFLDLFGPDRLLILRAEDYYADPNGELAKVSRFLDIEDFPVRGERPSHYNKLPRADMDPAIREQLIDYYQPYVDELQTRLDRDFGWKNFSTSQVVDLATTTPLDSNHQ